MNARYLVFLIGLQVFSVSCQETNADVELKIFHSETWDGCSGAISSSGKTCEIAGNNGAGISGRHIDESPLHKTTATGNASYSGTSETAFVHPNVKLYLENLGATGGTDRTSIRAEITSHFRFVPKTKDRLGQGILEDPLDVDIFHINLYDSGSIESPPYRRHFGFHDVSYGRSFTNSGVWSDDGATRWGFTQTFGNRNYGTSVNRGRDKPIDNHDDLKYRFIQPLFYEVGLPVEGRQIRFNYAVALQIDTDSFRLLKSEPAIGDISNTAGISGLKLFNSAGEDVTNRFDIFNDLGQKLFAVPEPSSMSLLLASALSCLFWRSR